jgi:glycerophosphoryl diester phosphodiesterase
MNFISKPLIWHLKRRGIMTYGWVCNTQESLERANWMGVQGIMSDEPFMLDEYVKNWENKNKK